MVVSWIPLTLSEARGFVTSYTVFYSPQVSRGKRQEPHTIQKTVSGDVNGTTIRDLDQNTAYDVQMSVSTKAGSSPLSEVISAPVPSTSMYDIITIFLYLTDFEETFFLNNMNLRSTFPHFFFGMLYYNLYHYNGISGLL